MTSNQDLTDLMARMTKGDKTAFAAFYTALEKPVYRFIAGKLNDPHEAADILHDVFMDIWRLAATFEGRSAVKTWVFGIAYRKTMDHFRKHGRVSVTDDVPEVEDESPDAVTCLAAAEEGEHLRHCLGTLSAEQRMAVELAFYEDHSYGEIASAAKVPEGTIKMRIFHAKKLLLHCLSGRMTRVAP